LRRFVLAIAVALGLLACSTNAGQPKLPAQGTGSLGRYELASGVRRKVDDASAYRFGHATLADAKRVAHAFGVAAPPKRDKNGWSFGPYNLSVEGVQPASAYVAKNGRFKVENMGGIGYSGSGPPPLEPPTTLTPVPPAHITNAEVKAIALRALRTAGATLPGAKVSVPYADGYSYEVEFAGRGDGYKATVGINQDGTITDANGIVTRAKPVATYKLAFLQRAVDRLNAGFGVDGCGAPSLNGLPGVHGCLAEPAGRPSDVTTLTGVTVGLMTSYDATHAWLIPAYLFTTSDHKTVVAPAAADRYFSKTH
jgi:hypothetical protein